MYKFCIIVMQGFKGGGGSEWENVNGTPIKQINIKAAAWQAASEIEKVQVISVWTSRFKLFVSRGKKKPYILQ